MSSWTYDLGAALREGQLSLAECPPTPAPCQRCRRGGDRQSKKGGNWKAAPSPIPWREEVIKSKPLCGQGLAFGFDREAPQEGLVGGR